MRQIRYMMRQFRHMANFMRQIRNLKGHTKTWNNLKNLVYNYYFLIFLIFYDSLTITVQKFGWIG